MNLTINSINGFFLIPEGLILTCLLILCLFEIFSIKISKFFILLVCSIFLLASSGFLVFDWIELVNTKGSALSFFNSFQTDSLTISFRLIIVFSSFLVLLFAFDYIGYSTQLVIEFNLLILTATLGGMLLSGANNLVMVFIGLETLSLPSYLLTAYTKLDKRSNEAGLKYFSLGAISSSILLYSFSLIYGFSNGAIEFENIHQNFLSSGQINQTLFNIPIIFLLVGIGFKLSAAPFHQWAPDVYEGSPTPVGAFLSIGSKAGVVCFAIRIFNILFAQDFLDWKILFEFLAILSLIIGNFGALSQQSFKRLLAYSSIGQIGFILIGFVLGTETGYISLIFYLFIYLFTNFGVFACVILYSLKTGKESIQDYQSLASKDPIFSFCLSICLLSLAGLPPLAGFFSKLYIFLLGWQEGHYFLIAVALLTSLVSIFYYLRIVKIMILPEGQFVLSALTSSSIQESEQFLSQQKDFQSNSSINLFSPSNFSTFGIGVLICTFATIFFGLFGQTFLDLAQQTVQSTSYISFS